MTYHHELPALRRTFSDGKTSNSAILSVAVAFFLFAVLITALVVSDVPRVQPAPGDDWHGNVAASGYAS